MYVFLSLTAIAALLIANELWSRKKGSHKEHSRKVVHIFVGSFAAFWPLFMSWEDIRFISLAFLVVVILSKLLNVFASIHEVERFSLGEISFAIAIGLMTFITKSDFIYAVSVMQMGLADGLAAVIGLHYGKGNTYKILSHKKSVAGTLTFFVCSLAIILIGSAVANIHLIWYLVLIASLLATIIENIALWGLDNLFLPIVVALILAHF